MDIEYSDGAQVEARIRNILTRSTNLSSSTAIAVDEYADWPVRYHLSPERSNLLRPFNFQGLDVLELGAGMGAISRYLAENAKTLTVVEGTQSRYSALCERLRDLHNWKGSVGNIAEFNLEKQFDVVCCIGVLEYSELYVKALDGLTPIQTFLAKTMQFLKDDGVLILAIENKLGLKYWNGACEDHTGLLFDGISGYPLSASPKTFSRKELLKLLKEAGAKGVDEFFPFPDYKMASSILSADFIEEVPALAADLATYRPYESYAVPRAPYFSDLLVAHNLAKAGLLKEMSNSFLSFISKNPDSNVRKQILERQLQHHECAWHYSSNRLNPTQTVFIKQNGVMNAAKASLFKENNHEQYSQHKGIEVAWHPLPLSPVETRTKLRQLLANHLYYGQSTQVFELLKNFISFSFSRWRSSEPTHLEGRALDATLSNACENTAHSFTLFDLEWTATKPIPKTWFVLRNVLCLRADFELLSTLNLKSLKEVYEHLLAQLGVAADFEKDIEREAIFQSLVTHEQEWEKYRAALCTVLLAPFPIKPLARDPFLEVSMRQDYLKLVQQCAQLQNILATPPHRIAQVVDHFLQRNPRIQRLVRSRRTLNTHFQRLKALLPYFYPRYKIRATPHSAEATKFQLLPSFGPLKKGWAKILLSVTGQTGSNLKLGMRSQGRVFHVKLERNGENTFGAMVRLYGDTEEIFLNQESAAKLIIQSAFIRQVTKAEAALRLILPQLPMLLARPELRKDFFSRGAILWKQGGFRGLIAWIQQQSLQGNVSFGDFYSSWVNEYDTLSDSDREEMKKRSRELAYRPLISILMPVYNTDKKWLEKALESVLAQLYPNWELCIADDASTEKHVRSVLESYQKKDPRIRVLFREENGHISAASNSALEMAAGEFIGLLDHDDELSPDALYYVVESLNADASADLLYSDEDKIDHRDRRFQPHFKPDWNPELFYSYNLITHFCVMRRSLVKAVGAFRTGFEGSQDYDLMLRIVEQTDKIRHIPKILYHWRAILSSVAGGPSAKPYAFQAAQKAIREHLLRMQIPAEVLRGVNDCHRVKYSLPNPLPLVSCVIGTRDRVDLLKGIMDGLLQSTDYPAIEIIIVDNQSREQATLDYFAALKHDPRIQIISYDAPFNFSAMNNLGAKLAKGELLALLNNDLKILHPDWLKEMMSYAVQKRVGAVGAKLYYESGRLQHGGIILGIGGVAGHSHKGLGKFDVDYQARTRVPQILSAVTAACLVVRKEVFEKVQGLDEVNLPVAFNDVDFCLKVREAGYANIWTPYAELVHLESESRGSDETPENQPRFKKEVEFMTHKWGKKLEADPSYSPNLSLDRQDFSLAFPPRLTKPWKKMSSNPIQVHSASFAPHSPIELQPEI